MRYVPCTLTGSEKAERIQIQPARSTFIIVLRMSILLGFIARFKIKEF